MEIAKYCHWIVLLMPYECSKLILYSLYTNIIYINPDFWLYYPDRYNKKDNIHSTRRNYMHEILCISKGKWNSYIVATIVHVINVIIIYLSFIYFSYIYLRIMYASSSKDVKLRKDIDKKKVLVYKMRVLSLYTKCYKEVSKHWSVLCTACFTCL